MSFSLAKPQIQIEENGIVRSLDSGDIYFSTQGGVEETRHVFLQGNGLPERWEKASHFTVFELGFGTGLNLIETLKTWKAAQKPSEAVLHYVSVEKAPLSQAQLQQIYRLWGEKGAEAQQLLAQYPLAVPGWHRLHFPTHNASVTLLWGEAFAQLSAWNTPVDAWFLDGFSPAKNPDMWEESLFARLFSLSSPGATVATYSAAAKVREGLRFAGFAVEKRKGYGHKRDMLVAQKSLERAIRPVSAQRKADVVVIGAGIAGASAARALADRGMRVTLIEKHTGAGAGASGNRAGIFYPFLAIEWSAPMRFYMQAFSYVTRQYGDWLRHAGQADLCGLIQLPKPSQAPEKRAELPERLGLELPVMKALNVAEASEYAGISLEQGGLYLPESGWVNVPAFCEYMINHRLIDFKSTCQVMDIQYVGHEWRVMGESGEIIARAPHAVLANAGDVVSFPLASYFTLEKSRGQVTRLQSTEETARQRCVICQEGMVTPAIKGVHVVGSTYEKWNENQTVEEESHRYNLDKLSAVSAMYGRDILGGWVSFRAVTKDRLPLIGPMCDKEGQALPGLYISAAHGSRGLLSAPMGAEYLADCITGSAACLAPELAEKISPARFL